MAYQRGEKRLDLVVAAEHLDIAPRTLRDWIREKRIKAVRKTPGRKRSPWLIAESEIARMNSEREAGVVETAARSANTAATAVPRGTH